MIKLQKYLLPLLIGTFSALYTCAQEESPTQVNEQVNTSDQNLESRETEDHYQDNHVEKHNFDKEEWKKATNGLNYDETPEKPKPEEVKKPPPEEKKDLPPVEIQEIPRQTSWFDSSVAQTILVIIAIAALSFILFKLMSGRVSNTKVKKQQGAYTIEQVEEALHESDLERFLREAIEKREYRLAIRIYYLMAIKELSGRDWITWKKDKTNRQYLAEMSGRPNFTLFREITVLFEYAWYGEMTLDEKHFNLLGPKFSSFLQELKKLPS